MILCISDGFAVGFNEQILSYNTNMTLSNISTESTLWFRNIAKWTCIVNPEFFEFFFSSNYTLIYNQ